MFSLVMDRCVARRPVDREQSLLVGDQGTGTGQGLGRLWSNWCCSSSCFSSNNFSLLCFLSCPLLSPLLSSPVSPAVTVGVGEKLAVSLLCRTTLVSSTLMIKFHWQLKSMKAKETLLTKILPRPPCLWQFHC